MSLIIPKKAALTMASIFLLCAGCGDKSNPGNTAALLSSSAHPTSPQNGEFASILEVPPQGMRAALKASYRLAPDRRFLQALAEIHRFFSKGEKKEAEALIKGNRWIISCNGVKVGEVPEYADFTDFMAMAIEWAKALAGQYPLAMASSKDQPAEIGKGLELFWASHLTRTLAETNETWTSGKRDEFLLYASLKALALLNLQSLDRLDITDDLAAKAIAALAITRATTAYDVTREESIISEVMDYASHASALAEKLPETDPVRAYIIRDNETLKKLSSGKDATVEARYLYLRRLAESGDRKEWSSWSERLAREDEAAIMPVFATGLLLGDFDATRNISKAIPFAAALILAKEAQSSMLLEKLTAYMPRAGFIGIARMIIEISLEMLNSKLSFLIKRFENDLDNAGKKFTGPFMDKDTYAAYYRGYFYSSLYYLGIHYLDSLSSVEEVKEFSAILGDHDTAIARDFERWYRNLASAKDGAADNKRLMDDITALKSLGAPQIMRTFDYVKGAADFGSPEIVLTVKRISGRLDSRPQHRFYLGTMAYSSLLDMKLTERLYEGVIKDSAPHYQSLHAWYAEFTGDTDLLYKLLQEKDRKVAARAKILVYLQKQENTDTDEIETQWRRLIEEDPHMWSLCAGYADFLDGLKKYEEARAVIRDWLAKNKRRSSDGFDFIFAKTALARMYMNEELYEEGLKEILPVVESHQSGAVEMYAALLYNIGKKDRALEVARFNASRYPDSIKSLMTLVELYWRDGAYGEAARILKAWRYPIDKEDWKFTVGKRFAGIFADKSRDEGLRAFSSLMEEGIDHFNLLEMASAAAKGGDKELAFKMSSQLRWPGMGMLGLRIAAYKYLKAWQDEGRALAWLRKNIPQEMLNPSAMIIYREKEYPLLWELVEEPEKGEHAEFVWLMRAAATAAEGNKASPYRDKVIEHFKEREEGFSQKVIGLFKADKKSDDAYYYQIGRYLLGLTSEETILSLATDGKKRCEISYYMGLLAQGEGRYDDASDWFRISVETGLTNNGEYRWSYDQLYRWQREGKSLKHLASEKTES